jgi:hypothetical protein
MSEDENRETKKEKKERVIHTRIPESLDEEIREHASRLGVSVSNLVRNVLQNAVDLVGDIVADSAGIAQSVTGEAPARDTGDGAGSPSPSTVLGWQEALLNLNAVCDRCNAILPAGTRAAIAITEGAGSRLFRCLDCLEELREAGRQDTGQ